MDTTTIIILVVVMCFIIIAVGGGGYFFLTKKDDDDGSNDPSPDKMSGDVCGGEDANAIYKYDENLECKKTECKPGFVLVDGYCITPMDFSQAVNNQDLVVDCNVGGYIQSECKNQYGQVLTGSPNFCGEGIRTFTADAATFTAAQNGGACPAASYTEPCTVPCHQKVCTAGEDNYTVTANPDPAKAGKCMGMDGKEIGGDTNRCGYGVVMKFPDVDTLDLANFDDNIDTRRKFVETNWKDCLPKMTECQVTCFDGMERQSCPSVEDQMDWSYVVNERNEPLYFDRNTASDLVQGNISLSYAKERAIAPLTRDHVESVKKRIVENDIIVVNTKTSEPLSLDDLLAGDGSNNPEVAYPATSGSLSLTRRHPLTMSQTTEPHFRTYKVKFKAGIGGVVDWAKRGCDHIALEGSPWPTVDADCTIKEVEIGECHQRKCGQKAIKEMQRQEDRMAWGKGTCSFDSTPFEVNCEWGLDCCNANDPTHWNYSVLTDTACLDTGMKMFGVATVGPDKPNKQNHACSFAGFTFEEQTDIINAAARPCCYISGEWTGNTCDKGDLIQTRTATVGNQTFSSVEDMNSAKFSPPGLKGKDGSPAEVSAFQLCQGVTELNIGGNQAFRENKLTKTIPGTTTCNFDFEVNTTDVNWTNAYTTTNNKDPNAKMCVKTRIYTLTRQGEGIGNKLHDANGVLLLSGTSFVIPEEVEDSALPAGTKKIANSDIDLVLSAVKDRTGENQTKKLADHPCAGFCRPTGSTIIDYSTLEKTVLPQSDLNPFRQREKASMWSPTYDKVGGVKCQFLSWKSNARGSDEPNEEGVNCLYQSGGVDINFDSNYTDRCLSSTNKTECMGHKAPSYNRDLCNKSDELFGPPGVCSLNPAGEEKSYCHWISSENLAEFSEKNPSTQEWEALKNDIPGDRKFAGSGAWKDANAETNKGSWVTLQI